MDLCGMKSLGYPPSNALQDGDDDTFLKFVAGMSSYGTITGLTKSLPMMKRMKQLHLMSMQNW